ncbi:MAG: N-acetylmuramoyl-L-alanine amidase [Clostridiales bacterium]|nr:N-acetylmuramoyl-L-alanine amidase [Clostridiales bacterium]
MKVIVDAGHGGYDNGAVYKDRREKDDTLALSLLLRDELEKRGIDVFLTRENDIYESPAEKAEAANKSGGDLFVSVHRNAAYAPNTYQGVQTLIYDRAGSKVKIAQNINEKLEEVGFNNINVEERPDLAVLRRTEMPAVLVEVGFIDNDYDNMLYDNNLGDIAKAIAEGITEVIAPKAAVSNKPVVYSNSEVDAFREQNTGNAPDLNEYNEEGEKQNNTDKSDKDFPDDVRFIKTDTEEESYNEEQEKSEYKIQVGYFNVFRYAKDLERELCMNGYDTLLSKEGESYILYVGPYDDISDAKRSLDKLKREGYDAFIV